MSESTPTTDTAATAAVPAAPTITIVGLGPGTRRLLTVEALETLRQARHIFFELAAYNSPAWRDLATGDELRPDASTWLLDGNADNIVTQILDDGLETVRELAAAEAEEKAPWSLGAEAGDRQAPPATVEDPYDRALVYPVLGHPLAGNPVVPLLLRAAGERGIAVRLVAGLGVHDAMYRTQVAQSGAVQSSLQVVPSSRAASFAGTATADQGLSGLWTDASARLLNAQAPLIVEGAVDEESLRRIVAWLSSRYPADHDVSLLRYGYDLDSTGLGVETRPLATIGEAEGTYRDVVGLYVPPLAPLDDARAPNTLGYITARLRAPRGCPWDREQTHASLTPYMIEEAYEAVDAIERDDAVDMVEELGDVLLQVVLHSQLAEEAGRFSLADVAEEVNRKLVRRHPHVFGDVAVSGSSEVLRNWEQIKRVEKGERRASVLDGIPPALPALLLAQTVGRKAAKVGFDWPDAAGALDKVREEIDEVKAAATDEERREEVGDLFFALTSVCRHLDVDAEDALRAAVRKFSGRFRRVEADAQARQLDLTTLSVPELDVLWDAAKAEE